MSDLSEILDSSRLNALYAKALKAGDISYAHHRVWVLDHDIEMERTRKTFKECAVMGAELKEWIADLEELRNEAKRLLNSVNNS